jgi:hypothetical protein
MREQHRAGLRRPSRAPNVTKEQLEQERANRFMQQEAYDLRMIKALGTVGIVITDPTRTPITWMAEEYYASSWKVQVTKAEAERRVGDCDDGLVFDGWQGIARPLTPGEKVAHLFKGGLPAMRPPDDYVQPAAFAGSPQTELV